MSEAYDDDNMLSKKMEEADTALHRLFEANRLLREAGERIAAAAGQTHARRLVLHATGAGATVPEIARTLGLHRQGVQRIADQLVMDGLASYADNPRHSRSKRLIATVRGQAALRAIRRAHDEWLRQLVASNAAADWSALAYSLEALGQAVRGLSERPVGRS